MKKLLAHYQRPSEIFLHLTSWLIVFAFPLLLVDHTNEFFSWERYLKHAIVPLSFVLVFYINYLWLIPRYLFKEQTFRYITYNIILLIGMGSILHIIQFQLLPVGKMPPMPNRPPHASWAFVLRDVFGMAFTIGISAIIRISRRWNRLETARREAERQRTEAELKNLRNQLNPHFLLNTLNNIYALIAFDAEKAQGAVQELSKLLRHMLYENQQMYVPLGREAEFIHNYIELMRIRLASNVRVETHIDVDKESQTPIAPLIFISLIENAFKHGVSPTEPSYIHISLSEKDEEVTCEIINTNHPKNTHDKSGSGIGLAQVSKRLELLYKGYYTWETTQSADGKEYCSYLTIRV